MSAQRRILVACGTAVATSTVVGNEIKKALEKRGIQATIQQCKASEVPSLSIDADLIVTTTPVSTNKDIPIIQTLAFVTGIGKDAVIEQIIEKLVA